MDSRFDFADKRLMMVAALALVLSGVYVWWNYDAAFPQASLTLPLSRDQITRKAEEFLATRSLATTHFHNITLFDPEEDARLYLERELGLSQANRLMQFEVPVWRWRARWFHPPEKEEIVVWLRPNGGLTGFEHHVLETDPGPRLDRASARLLAEAFLASQTSLPHKLVAEQSESRPNRDDHVFTWEQEGFRAKDATLRRTVEIYGDKVGRYREFLYIPEQWQRDFTKLRSSNELYASIAQGIYALLGIGALFFLLDALRKRLIPWRPLVLISLTVSVFYLLNELNQLHFAIDGMPTNSTLGEMILLALLQSLGGASGVLLYVLAPLAAGYMLYKRMWPLHLTPDRAFTRTGVGTRSFFRATFAGVTLFAAHLSFLTAFYLFGAKWGVWSPQDVQYSDLVATPFPWIYPIAIAMMAASAEEFWFRFLAIPLVRKLVRFRWMAIVIPAFTWGFLHANYPQQPGYVRGVEVGLIGVAAGLVMQRYGIVATLVWHYMIDAFLIGLSLFRAENWIYRAQGGIVGLAILAPVIVSVVSYVRNRGFVPEPVETPAPAVTEEPPPARTPALEPVPVLWPARRLYLSAAVLGVLALFLRPSVYGDFVRVTVSREQAEAAATQEMRARKLDPAGWRSVSDFSPNLHTTDFEYLREQVGARRANEILRDRLLHAVWQVRFFQPLQSEEWRFYVNPRGEVYRFDHVLDEKAAGAKPSMEEARRMGESYLASRQKLPTQLYTLVDSQEDKHDHRIDHSFVWEDSSFKVGEARLRVALQMVGDEPCEYRPFLKLPEAWQREFTRTRITSFLPSAILGIAGVPLIVIFFRRMGAPDQRFHWRIYTYAALVTVVLSVAVQLLNSTTWLGSYDTSTPISNFYGRLATSIAVSVLMSAGGVFASLLAFDVYRQAAVPMRSLPRPSLARAAALVVVFAALDSILGWVWQQAPGQHLSWRTASIPDADPLLPAIGSLVEAAFQSTLAVCLVSVAVCGALVLLRRRGIILLVAATVLALSLSRVAEPIQVPFAILATVGSLAAVMLVLMTCTLDALTIGVAIFWTLAAAAGWAMLQQPLSSLRWNGIGMLAGAILAGLLLLQRARRSQAGP